MGSLKNGKIVGISLEHKVSDGKLLPSIVYIETVMALTKGSLPDFLQVYNPGSTIEVIVWVSRIFIDFFKAIKLFL